MMAIETAIQDRLTALEKERGVRVLFACESGSRAWGFAWISSPIRPWPTMAGERAPVEASAKRSWTSRARASLPLMR